METKKPQLPAARHGGLGRSAPSVTPVPSLIPAPRENSLHSGQSVLLEVRFPLSKKLEKYDILRMSSTPKVLFP